MTQVFINVLEGVLSEREYFNRVWFASDHTTPPPFSYQVNFPRMEFVIKGEYINKIEDPEFGITEVKVLPGDILYIPPNSWNKPEWDTDCSVLSLLFGKRQLGFSLVEKRKNEATFFDVQKHSVQTRTGHALDHILNGLNTLAKEKTQHPTGGHLLMALMSYCHGMLLSPESSTQGRSEDLYQGICIYIQENFHRDITRDSIASRFNVSPNHLSRLFRQQGHMRLADYITWVRLERAKFMLTRYTFRLSEVALRCGFNDVNYFYRVFKNKLGRTPSEFRAMHGG
ncbi:helix-turn-helix transcriptional regulator [Vibrio sp. S17_S38]|uniref:helix-turn-helix transcriptional regulator n=1 Tax=Vibrio sp. S17_S38 TaxID=2720229 RepID=UPI0016801999|nr:AraC family transcriptional regulator [Vibrio sp. S17_S38]MBD1573513.1 helix-turn-helix transcriptional regulator [Vibrio sp. S17_S38]